MKRFAIFFCLTVISLGFTINFAQSRRVTEGSGKKNNRQPTKPVESPTPPAATTAQTVPENSETDDSEVIKVETGLVSMPVKVVDRSGKFIAGLTKENFKVFEDGIEQQIEYFSNEQQPFTVALVLDMSYSAKFKAEEIQGAALAFIDQLRPTDKVMVVSFDQEVYIHCEPTNDRKTLQAAILKTKIDYGTSIYEALDLVMNEKFKKIDGRKAIVLFTDGVDTSSRRSNDLRNLSDALELDALIYPIEYDTFNEVQAMKVKPVVPQPGTISIGNNPESEKGTTIEEYKRASEYLAELANRTGGRLYKASTIANLSNAFSRIASELREYYSIGYYPKSEAEKGKKYKIKVRVDREGARVKARDSYIGRK